MVKPLALIIEDDIDLASMYAEALEAADYVTLTVHDGLTAVARLAQEVPDLILMDMHLPGMHGRDILHLIRSDNRLKAARVVLSTADPNATVGDTGALADIVFIKPVSYAQLQHIARRLRPADNHL